jgi:hypothetical protein
MAAASSTSWVRGFSDRPPDGSVEPEPLVAKSIIEMLDRVGDEEVVYPTGEEGGRRMTRRELLARVIWTRAIVDADGTATKLIIEYLDGKPGETQTGEDGQTLIRADDWATAEALVREVMGHERGE